MIFQRITGKIKISMKFGEKNLEIFEGFYCKCRIHCSKNVGHFQ